MSGNNPIPSLEGSNGALVPTTIFAGLTTRQANFVRFYVQIGTKIGAYRAAGYKTEGRSPREDARDADDLYRNPKVQDALARWQDYVTAQAAVTSEEILAGLRFIAHHDAAEIFEPGTMELKPVSAWPEAHRRAAQKIRIRIDHKRDSTQIEVEFPDRVKAYELLGKHKRLWDQPTEGPQYHLTIQMGPQDTPAQAEEPAQLMEMFDAGTFQLALPRQRAVDERPDSSTEEEAGRAARVR